MPYYKYEDISYKLIDNNMVLEQDLEKILKRFEAVGYKLSHTIITEYSQFGPKKAKLVFEQMYKS